MHGPNGEKPSGGFRQDKIAEVVADVCGRLLSLWQSAWRLVDGDHINRSAGKYLKVLGLYDKVLNQKDFLPSILLKRLAETAVE